MNVYIYILVMAAVTYLIRMIPLVLVKGKINNRFIRSFLYYVPYACLMAMTFPAVFFSTSSMLAAIAGVGVAIILALKGKGLMTVALAASITVFLVSFIPV
ncbi:MAG: AzlD domain-containing protein [Lachnospiraceae bacterium]|jgi:branched-subunit amino acid transport protein|nr:AzlD domain-containing protein [Lachnospiraceae bacterium]MBR3579894.1 AzlD domain-containing protein [Lachnospiraceae bacterium]MBR4541466.1 AzlD domain-containing protein [Lachnospiraceae bacterium]